MTRRSRTKVAISIDGHSPDAPIGAPFGRCTAFVIANATTQGLRVVRNHEAGRTSDAGTSAARFMIEEGVEAVVSGRFGRKAPMMLHEAGIATFRMTGGTARELVYRLREMTPPEDP